MKLRKKGKKGVVNSYHTEEVAGGYPRTHTTETRQKGDTPNELIPQNKNEGGTPQKYNGFKFAVIESDLLDGERILLVSEKKYYKEAREKYPDMTMYFPPEIERLYEEKNDHNAILAAHAIKKNFAGWIHP